MITATAAGTPISANTRLEEILGLRQADINALHGLTPPVRTLGEAQKRLAQSKRTLADGKVVLDLSKFGISPEASDRIEVVLTGTAFRVQELKTLIGDAPASADPVVSNTKKNPFAEFAKGIAEGITGFMYQG